MARQTDTAYLYQQCVDQPPFPPLISIALQFSEQYDDVRSVVITRYVTIHSKKCNICLTYVKHALNVRYKTYVKRINRVTSVKCMFLYHTLYMCFEKRTFNAWNEKHSFYHPSISLILTHYNPYIKLVISKRMFNPRSTYVLQNVFCVKHALLDSCVYACCTFSCVYRYIAIHTEFTSYRNTKCVSRDFPCSN